MSFGKANFRVILKMRGTFTAALVASLVLLAYVVALAEPSSITPSQREQLKSLASDMRTETQRVLGDLMRARMDLFAAYQSWDLDEQKVRQAISRISKAQLALLSLHLENQIALRRILSSSQFAELARRVVKHGGHRHKGWRRPYEDNLLDRLPDRALLDAAGASAEQVRKILQLANPPRRQAIVDNLERYSKQLVDLFSYYDLDVAAARRLIDRIHECQSELLDLSLERQQALRAVLTQDQFEKLQDLISKRFRMMRPGPPPRPPRALGRG